ncbi:MAG: hypothetical protein VX670_06250 [Candidatus Latescibacterota bacterium]|nr:hypothetical protein [Candidatus Latescibacterota bacterium]MEE2628068.1 hypothetical protein [Candidatus Latescibacterota bacterium]MEE2725656.1 hypothetical protein [Candidatus Latescibacterota bacterium]
MDLQPDLLKLEDGSAVTAQNWSQRRTELSDIIVPSEYGGMPPSGRVGEPVLFCSVSVRAWDGVVYETYEVRTTFADGKEHRIKLSLWIPPGEGPFPVLLYGDGCWYMLREETVHHALERGNIVAVFDRTEAAADNSAHYRETGLYRLYPEASFGALSAWAWAYHRCVDALLQMPNVRADAIAISGHSRGGKTVLLAGATDERIALVNPNNSGIGGAGLNRWKADGAETVDSFFHSGNIFWFGDSFAEHRHRDGQLPYDQHFLLAMVAPRPLLLTEAYEDYATNPPGTYAACVTTQSIYALLDRPAHIGWAFREGGHAHSAADFLALLDFMDVHLHERTVSRNFQRGLFPDIDSVLHPVLG